MITSEADFQNWLVAPGENERLEFKEAKSQGYDSAKLLRRCVAMANEGGGKVVLGVSDRPPREVVGTATHPNPIKWQAQLRDTLPFRVDVEELSFLGKRVLVLHIPPRPRGTAYQLDGAYLMRSGEDTVPMTEDRLRQIFQEGKPDWLLENAKAPCDAADVISLLDTQGYFDLLKLPYPGDRGAVLDRLSREKLIVKQGEGWAISNLGALAFAKRLQDFEGIGRKATRVVVYEGNSKLKTRSDTTGIRGYAVSFESLVEFINSQVPMNEVVGRALREDVKMFPTEAIRELVANALIHQDFGETGGSVVIELYSDRLEISNPGRPSISTDRFIDEYQSRNERLADLMRRARICEEKGSGIDRVVNAAEVFQLPAPDFREGERRTIAVLFAYRNLEEMDRSDRVRACYQHCCLRYVVNQRMTNQSLRERFKLPETKAETISRMIREALDDGRIKYGDPGSRSKRYASYVPFWA